METYQLLIALSILTIIISIFISIFRDNKNYMGDNILYGKMGTTPWLSMKLEESENYYGSSYVPEHILTQIELGRSYKEYHY